MIFCYNFYFYSRNVRNLTSTLLLYLGPCQLFQYFLEISNGLIRATANQMYGSITCFISFYLVMLGVGIPLMLLTPVGVSGKKHYWL